MNTKADLLAQVDTLSLEGKPEMQEALKDLCKTLINRAYDIGFAEGMKMGAEVMTKTQDMLFNAMRK